MFRTAGILCLTTLFVFLFITLNLPIGSADIGQLPFCGPSSSDEPASSLVFVSTLDGKISALDAARRGEKKWTLDFDEGPMISSNIHRRELNNNGQWVRLIPSLKGGLYKFDGENLEAVPITTDNLLQSSFRFSDDLVFSGGKETHSYGVSTKTGEILYECNINGCTNKTDGENYDNQKVLVIQRFQQTVRAVEPRTGHERWNFSVGQHDLTLIPENNLDCHDDAARKATKTTLNIELKVIVPEGLVYAVNKSNPDVKLWQHKFDSPIVSIWQEDTSSGIEKDGGLQEVDLFKGSQWIWGAEATVSPSVYLGMHQKQLYVQESKELYRMLENAAQRPLQGTKFPWQPYPATSTAVAVATKDTARDEATKEILEITDDTHVTSALSVLYASEYVNGNGFYLYTNDDLRFKDSDQCNGSNSDTIIIEKIKEPSLSEYLNEGDDTPVNVIIVSLWYWWKEVIIISITTAVLLNFMLTQRLLNATTVTRDALLPPLIVETHYSTKEKEPKVLLEANNNPNYNSRYLTDFEPIDCLGKGGYGVVFEAKNKIDDCNYAIKRIALPNSRDSRERVMREVKALAKLDHHNIVRYFNAWLECPPAGWQEEHDQYWIDKQKFPPSEFPSEMSHTTTKPSGSVCIDVPQSEPSSVDSALEAYKLDHPDDDDDSFIVFDKSESGEIKEHQSVINVRDDSNSYSTNYSASKNRKSTGYLFNDETNRSESIVFETSNGTAPAADVKSRSERKRSMSLNLDSKSMIVNRKSTKMFLYIQMQLCQRLSLREWLKHQGAPRNIQRIMNIFQQIVDAVEYVHLQGLIHRDLKPSNIFFAYDEKIKIGDFGLVTAMTEGCDEARTPGDENEVNSFRSALHTARVGTHLYMSPEQMSGQMYNYKVDIYSLGIILFELLVPFSTEMERIVALSDLRKSIFPTEFSSKYPAEFKLLNMMLDNSPSKRPTTLGIKARPPLGNLVAGEELGVGDDSQWHFELPQLSRHSSITSGSSGDSWENIS